MSTPKFKVMLIVFSISGVLCTLFVCLKVRLATRFIVKMFWRISVNVCDEGDLTCGTMHHGFFITTTRQHTTRYLWRGVWRKRHSSDGKSTVHSGPSNVRLFSLPENQVSAQRNQVRVRGCSENKSDATLEQLNTRWTAALFPTVENSQGAV